MDSDSDVENPIATQKSKKLRLISSSDSEAEEMPAISKITKQHLSNAINNACSTSTSTATKSIVNNPTILSYYSVAVKRSDLDTLQPHKLIEDTVLSFYFEYLQHEVFPNNGNMAFISPTVVQHIKLVEDCSETVRNMDIDDKEYIFMPLNDSRSAADISSHWSLLVFSRPHNKCYLFDSRNNLQLLQNSYSAYQTIATKLDMADSGFETVDCLTQGKTVDCALHVMANAENVVNYIIEAMSTISNESKPPTLLRVPKLEQRKVDTKREELIALITSKSLLGKLNYLYAKKIEDFLVSLFYIIRHMLVS